MSAKPALQPSPLPPSFVALSLVPGRVLDAVASGLIVHCTSGLGSQAQALSALPLASGDGTELVVWLHQPSRLAGLRLSLIKLPVPVCRDSVMAEFRVVLFIAYRGKLILSYFGFPNFTS